MLMVALRKFSVEACALGQAACGIVSDNIIGASLAEVQQARSDMRQMLSGKGADFEVRFKELEFLEPVKDHANRHASTMLILEAICEAFEIAILAKDDG